MQITDTIADMLTRIRNASSAKRSTVDVPASNVKKAIAQILLDEGYEVRGSDTIKYINWYAFGYCYYLKNINKYEKYEENENKYTPDSMMKNAQSYMSKMPSMPNMPNMPKIDIPKF